MNVEKILDYQKKDFEIYKKEKELYQGEDRKAINEMIKKVKLAQSKSIGLEKRAKELNAEFEKLKKTFEKNIDNVNRMQKTNYEKLSGEDLESFQNTLGDLVANLNVIEGKLSYFAKSINVVLADFEKAKKAYANARVEYDKHKSAYEEVEKKIKPEIEKGQKELLELEKDIDKELFAKYRIKRQDKRFPIIVPLLEKSCGGCQMQLSYSSLSNLKSKGLIECEHCRRLIYNK